MKTAQDRDRSVAIGPPGQPVTCRGRVKERARVQWRIGDPGRPDEVVRAALAGNGVLVDFRDTLTHRYETTRRHGFVECLPRCNFADVPGTVCGAAVLISAAACNLIAGRDAGPVTPAAGVPDVVVVVYEHGVPDQVPGAPRVPWVVGPWRRSWTAEQHAAAVRQVRGEISRGEVYQVNVVGHWSAPYQGDPSAPLATVAGLPGARYAGIIAGDGWAVGCASPEALVTVADGWIETRPIKGTRPATPQGRTELLGSAKERAEHVMIVDLERNDLSRVAQTGSVRVAELFGIRRWCQLWQAESVIQARLATGVYVTDLLAALCPGGSVTGAPKLAAIDQIAAREAVGRGPSMGVFGFVSPNAVDLGLTIRTVAFDGGADAGTAHVWAGGGITWSSDPVSEVAEAEAKAAPLLAAVSRPRPAGAEVLPVTR